LQEGNLVRRIAVRLGLKKIAPVIFNSGLNEVLETMLDMLEPNPQAQLLDLGCGEGSNTLKYASKVGTKNIYGIEIINEYVKVAESNGIGVYAMDLNQKWSGIKSGDFDVVVSNQVIEHLWNTRLFVSEIFRVLKSHSYAVVATENLASWPNIFALLSGYQPFSSTNICGYSLGNPLTWHLDEPKNVLLEKYKDSGGGGAGGHVRVLAYRAFKDIFLAQGFHVESLKGVGYFPFKGKISKPLSNLNPSHAHFMIIKARKP